MSYTFYKVIMSKEDSRMQLLAKFGFVRLCFLIRSDCTNSLNDMVDFDASTELKNRH